MKIPSHIQAVIFDMDGVIVDTVPIWKESIVVFLKKHNLRYDSSTGDIIGMGIQDIIILWQKKLGLEGDTHRLAQELREDFYTIALDQKKLRLLPGVHELLVELKDLKCAVATGGHNAEHARAILEQFHLASFFSEIVSSDDVSKGKPDPEVYTFTASRLGFPPENCLILEDTPVGVQAGKAAGMTVVGVNKDQSLRDKLKKAGADELLQTLEEIE